jgi:hypothetical protein
MTKILKDLQKRFDAYKVSCDIALENKLVIANIPLEFLNIEILQTCKKVAIVDHDCQVGITLAAKNYQDIYDAVMLSKYNKRYTVDSIEEFEIAIETLKKHLKQ